MTDHLTSPVVSERGHQFIVAGNGTTVSPKRLRCTACGFVQTVMITQPDFGCHVGQRELNAAMERNLFGDNA